MNNNTLMKELYIVLKTSGWLDAANKYFREHPEKFNDCINSGGKIASINLAVSYQPDSLSDVADVDPNVFISMGRIATEAHEFNVYHNGHTQSRTWIDNNLVVEVSNNV